MEGELGKASPTRVEMMSTEAIQKRVVSGKTRGRGRPAQGKE